MTFKKNDRAFLIQSWDDKGTFKITPVIVASCGKRQMTLTHAETGEMLGRNFKPGREQYRRFDLVVQDQAEKTAFEQSMTFLAYQREHFRKCLQGCNSPGYVKAIQASMEDLHEPRVI